MAKRIKAKEFKLKVEPPKGRPMLYWVGKSPLEHVKGFPAVSTEVFDPEKSGVVHEPPLFRELEKDWQNLLFHGDNKEVLATLLENGFRGKVDLIYIDPPFDSGANYVRKAELRGVKTDKLEGADYTPMEQTMYFDIWKNDTYLQWMYERLQLLKELVSEKGSIYVHLDYRRNSQIRLILDEIFGEEKFVREIIWNKGNVSGFKSQANNWVQTHDSILFYRKGGNNIFNKLRNDYSQEYLANFNQTDKDGRPYWQWSPTEKRYLDDLKGLSVSDVWDDNAKNYSEKDVFDFDTWNIPYENNMSRNREDYPTQKPEALLERIIKASSNKDDVVLDCFIGSGTTAAVAQKLGRRWIGCDINKGAIQTTSKRLQKIINEQLKGKEKTQHPSFAVYQVNDYDLQVLRTEAVELAVEHIGIERRKTDPFFDGLLGKELVKIIDFNHPLTLLDLQLVADELKKRPDEERNIALVCLGKELAADGWVDDWNKKPAHTGSKGVNKIRVIELRTDKKYGKFLTHQPNVAEVEVKRSGSKAVITLKNFVSPTIIERLNDGGIFKLKIPDFRAMIDTVLIDTNYDGKTFRVALADVPEKKSDYIAGRYEVDIPKGKTTIAVKIIDMLGEEVLKVVEV